jgi:antitoxin (DNA-binding transcriptional repressor) of toxin-antitoxin stability system
MVMQVNMPDANNQLSRLLKGALAGEVGALRNCARS